MPGTVLSMISSVCRGTFGAKGEEAYKRLLDAWRASKSDRARLEKFEALTTGPSQLLPAGSTTELVCKCRDM